MSWQTVKLGDVCDVRDGTHDSPKFIESGFALITSKNLINGKIDKLNVSYISESDFININKRSKVDCGDILMAMIGTIGNPVIVTDEIPNFAIKNVALLKFNNDLLDRFFIKQLLQSSIFNNYIAQTSKGGTQKFLSLGDIRKFPIPLPPISEQKRIAAILDKADEIRRKREQAIAKLEQLAQSIFVEMFGDPVTNNKNFERKKLGEIIKFEGGSQPQASYFSSLSSTENIRLVQIRDFKTEKFKTYIPIALAKRFFELDDVMIGRYGPPVFQILRGLSGAYNVALMKAVPRDNVLKDFIFYLLQEKKLHNYVVANSERTAGQSGVNLELLEKYEAYLPPLALQEEFAQRINQIEKLKADNTTALANHNALFASLQQQAFSGNL